MSQLLPTLHLIHCMTAFVQKKKTLYKTITLFKVGENKAGHTSLRNLSRIFPNIIQDPWPSLMHIPFMFTSGEGTEMTVSEDWFCGQKLCWLDKCFDHCSAERVNYYANLVFCQIQSNFDFKCPCILWSSWCYDANRTDFRSCKEKKQHRTEPPPYFLVGIQVSFHSFVLLF